jgi:NDP-sugar pyrophosphorylase family protein
MEGKLVILAGGISSRMKKPANLDLDQTLIRDADEKSKSMIRVGDNYRPFLDYLLFNAKQAGYSDIVLVIGEKDSSIREYYGFADNNNEYKELSISYAVQPVPEDRIKPLGTADALYWGLKSKPEWEHSKFSVCNSDNLYSVKALTLMLNSPYLAALIDYDRSYLEFELSRIERFAVILKNEGGFLTDIIEKPSAEKIKEIEDITGFIGVSMNIFSLTYNLMLPILEKVPLHPERNEKELPEALKILANSIRDSVFVYPLKEHVPDLTSKEDIIQVKNYLQKNYPEFSF